MNAIPSKPAALRDHFGVHQGPGRMWAALVEDGKAGVARVSAALRRRVTLEQGLWLLIVVLLIGFAVVLIAGDTAVGRGGR
jgi:hypothetical protein